MAYNLYQPQYHPGAQPIPYQQPSQSNNSIIWVQGEAAAKAYPVSAGQSRNNWDSDYSYSRGRDSHSRNDVIDQLTDMMRSARSEEERENYRKTIDQLTR